MRFGHERDLIRIKVSMTRFIWLRVWPGGLHLDPFTTDGSNEGEMGDEVCGWNFKEL